MQTQGAEKKKKQTAQVDSLISGALAPVQAASAVLASAAADAGAAAAPAVRSRESAPSQQRSPAVRSRARSTGRSCAQSTEQTLRLLHICDQSTSFLGVNRAPAVEEAAGLFEQDRLHVQREGLHSSNIHLLAPCMRSFGSREFLFLQMLEYGGLLRFGEQRLKESAEATVSATALLPHLCSLIRAQLSADSDVAREVRAAALAILVVEWEPNSQRVAWRVPVLQALLDAGASPHEPVLLSDHVMSRRRQDRHQSLLLMLAMADWPAEIAVGGARALLRAGADPAPDDDRLDLLQVWVQQQAVDVLGAMTQDAESVALLASLSFDVAEQYADALVVKSAAGAGSMRAQQTRHELRLLRGACDAHRAGALRELEVQLIPDLANIVADYLRTPEPADPASSVAGSKDAAAPGV